MPWCPECRVEYRPGYKTCSDCNKPLVDELEPIKKNDDIEADEAAYLTTVSGSTEAGLIEALLNSNGIPVLRKCKEAGGYLNIYMGTTTFGIDLYVPLQLLQVAKDLIVAKQGNIEDIQDDSQKYDIEEPEEHLFNKIRRRNVWIFSIILIFIFLCPVLVSIVHSIGVKGMVNKGSMGYSGNGGSATGARLEIPDGVAVDAYGNIYIADRMGCRVCKVNSSGIISTVAGNGESGYSGDSGPATRAELKSPQGVAVDSTGNLYIADTGNNRIRMVNTGGIITTVTGNGYTKQDGLGGYSGDGGPATSAELNVPLGIALDTSGNLYIADSINFRVRRVNTGGLISTVASGGGLSSVIVDEAGNLYFAEAGRVCKMNTSGLIVTIASLGPPPAIGVKVSTNGSAATLPTQPLAERVMGPLGVAVDASGNLYIADSQQNRVLRVNKNGVTTTMAGNGAQGFSGDGGPATEAKLFLPQGVAVDSLGNIYIADTGNSRIRKVNTKGIITTVAGSGGGMPHIMN